MKKTLLIIVSVIIVAAMSVSFLGSFALESGSERPAAASSSEIKKAMANSIEGNNALSLRLTQLLELNRVFDECIEYDNVLVDEASIVLLDQAETDENMNSIITRGSVASFIYDLYGKKIDISALPEEYTKGAPAGYFNIISRGYDSISQSITDISVGDDGRIIVLSDVTISGHEGGEGKGTATTVFVKNDSSAFGYNIVSAQITSFGYSGENSAVQSAPQLDLAAEKNDSVCLY